MKDKIRKEDLKWQIEDDAYILKRAYEIKLDEEREKRAIKKLVEDIEKEKEETKKLEKIIGNEKKK